MKSKSEIFAQQELPRAIVNVPEWGGDVLVATLRANERDRMESDWRKRGGPKGEHVGFRAFAVARCVVDAEGQRVFGDDDVPELGALRADIISRLFDKACELNALTKSDEEELAKN